MFINEIFKALSDPVRREILFLLKDSRLSAGEISNNFNMTKATISYHLTKLKEADLIFETKYKNFIYYELNTALFQELIIWFSSFRGGNENE